MIKFQKSVLSKGKKAQESKYVNQWFAFQTIITLYAYIRENNYSMIQVSLVPFPSFKKD